MRICLTQVIAACFVFPAIVPAVVLGQGKSLRTLQEVVPEQLDAAHIAELKDAWTKDGVPTIQVVVGQDVNGAIASGHTALETQLSASVREQLASAIDPGRLVDATALWTQQMRDVQDTANQTGQHTADVVADEMRNEDKAAIVMFVHLQPQTSGQYAVTLEVVDPAQASQLAATAFLQIAPDADVSRINAYATSIVSHFTDQYAGRVLSPGGPLYTYRIRIIGIDSDEDADALAAVLKKMDGVVGRVEHSYDTAAGNIGLASYTLAMKDADPDDLKESLVAAVKANMEGHALFVSRSTRGSVIGSVLKTTAPRWWVATSEEDDDADKIAAMQEKREKAMGLSRRLKVAVIIGPALEQPAMLVEDASTPLKNDFDEATLRDSLQTVLSTAGFDSVDDVSLKQGKQLAEQQFGRFVNSAHLTEAADDKKDFEYLIYGDEKTDSGGTRYEFRLIDRESGSVIATQAWPDAQSHQIAPKYQPKNDEPKSVARYICGNLIVKLNRRLVDKRLTMQVVVKNTDDVAKIAKIAEVFRNVSNVSSVENMNYSLPIGGFEITFDGSADSLLQALTIAMPRLDIPLSIDTFGDRQMAINLARTVGPEKPPEVRKQQLQQVAASPQGKTLQQCLLAARSSVWVVGFSNSDGSFDPIGTAWTVAPQKLATNMHVVDALVNECPTGAFASARRGDDESVSLKLGAPTQHPGFVAWLDLAGKFNRAQWDPQQVTPVCDVALIDVSEGDAGKPLAIASAEHMNALLPGDSIGYLGFPMENKSNIRQLPTMMTDMGTVSAYTDAFHQPRQQNDLGLLQYTLRTSGGASGSPVFNAEGEVIALNSAGDETFMLKEIVKPSRYIHLVVNANNEFATKGGKLLVAFLNRPGVPIQAADATVAVKDGSTSQLRALENGEEVHPAGPEELTFDESGVVTAVNDVRRVNFGFSYGQSVDMLRELLDGSAESKQAARTAEWERRAEELHLLKSS